MEKKKIVVIEPLNVDEDTLRSELKKFSDYDLVYYNSRSEEKEELVARGKDASILVVSNIRLDKSILENFKKLEMICVAFTGVDHLDVDYCKNNNIIVSNASGYATQGVAELTFGLIFDLYRNIKIGDKEVRAGDNHNNRLGIEVSGKKFGVVGAGAIGSEVVSIAQAFKAEVLVYNRSQVTLPNVKQVSLEEIFTNCDIVSIHLPLNNDTKGMINKDLLSLMKKDAILINTARGPIVDNDYLAEMLSNNKIMGAGIDVFDYEPPLNKDYKLLNAPNTTLSPHIAYYTKEAMEKRFKIVLENIKSFIQGSPINVIK